MLLGGGVQAQHQLQCAGRVGGAGGDVRARRQLVVEIPQLHRVVGAPVALAAVVYGFGRENAYTAPFSNVKAASASSSTSMFVRMRRAMCPCTLVTSQPIR